MYTRIKKQYINTFTYTLFMKVQFWNFLNGSRNGRDFNTNKTCSNEVHYNKYKKKTDNHNIYIFFFFSK